MFAGGEALNPEAGRFQPRDRKSLEAKRCGTRRFRTEDLAGQEASKQRMRELFAATYTWWLPRQAESPSFFVFRLGFLLFPTLYALMRPVGISRRIIYLIIPLFFLIC